MRQYRIVKYIERHHELNKETQLYDLYECERFYAQRKGKIFGFWHSIGDWMCDSQGNSFCMRDIFDSISQAESYIKCWHKETYPNENYEILPEVNFK